MKAVIWDMGGVLLRTADQSLRREWEQKLGLQEGELHDLVFGNDLSRRASLGQASEEDVWNWVQGRLSLDDQKLADLRRDFFLHDLIDSQLVDFIRALKEEYTVGMITNAWPNIRHMLTAVWGVADAFEKIIVSAEEGLVKPDPAIYKLALAALDIAPADAVFVDDFIENVDGARAVGMRAVHFTGREDAIRQLGSMLELPAGWSRFQLSP